MYRDEKGRFTPKPAKAALQRANAAYTKRISWSEPREEISAPETHPLSIETHKQEHRAPSILFECILFVIFVLLIVLKK